MALITCPKYTYGFDAEILNENVKFHHFGKNKCSEWFRFQVCSIGGVRNRQKWWMEKPAENCSFQVFTFETHRKDWCEKWFSSTNLIFNAFIVFFIRDATQMRVWAVSFVTGLKTICWHLTILNNKQFCVFSFNQNPHTIFNVLSSTAILSWKR